MTIILRSGKKNVVYKLGNTTKELKWLLSFLIFKKGGGLWP